jgi:NAD(P)-dependent dehydrogenase (short-subunit alcohol dehydrogenase family)
MSDLLDFSGSTVVITGAATGMGNETTRLLLDAGAEVHAIDVAPVELDVASAHRCDLSDPASIDATVAELPARVDVLMNCAGIPNGANWSPLQIMQVNILGLRHLTDALVDRIPSGGSVTNVASIAGNTWASHVAELTELLETADFAAGTAWCEQHEEVVGDGYFFSKEAVQFFTMWRSAQTIRSGVRMNAICPGVTDTKLLVDFRRGIGDDMLDMTVDVGLGRAAQPEEMAPALVFLSHPTAASYINGANLIIDGGFTAAMSTGQVDMAKYFS